MRSLICLFILIANIMELPAQPVNDDCIDAISIPLSPSEQEIILTNGDTRNATLSQSPEMACAQIWLSDDVWFQLNTPDSMLSNGFTVKAYFDYFMDTMDVPAIGMALYASCDSSAAPLRCFSSTDPKENTIILGEPCIGQNQTYFIRIWSTGNTSGTEGKFRIGAFVNQHQPKPLWKETFGNGIENGGWTTYGTCEEPDSNHNAGWKYHEDGIFDDGLYIYEGFAINSPSVCDGAVGVDSDYNNTGGIVSFPSLQYCGNPSMHYLVSPVLYTGNLTAPGITLSWHQALRNFESHHFIGYRWRDEFNEWSDWEEEEVNTEFPANGNAITDDVQRHLLPNAAHHDSLQFRFGYTDHFYFWIIDDVELVPTEENNVVLDKDFYAIPPFAQIPADQVDEYFALAAFQNIGVADQHGVQIHHIVQKENSIEPVDEQTIHVGDLPALSADTTKWFFPNPVSIPGEAENFNGTYTVTQDETDFDTTDNRIEYNFKVGGTTFANEDGPTRSFNFQKSSVFIKTDAWGYGNVFYPVKDVAVKGLTFGVILAEPLPGDSINLNLIEWHDQNEDQISQASERILVGSGTYHFEEEDGWIISTIPLTNVTDPGSRVVMAGGKIYFAMMEYPSHDISNEGKVQMLVSEERNFVPTVAAFDSAYMHGLTDRRRYMSVLQFSPDGVISNVDFYVRPNFTGTNLHPGDHIVPMVRIETELIISTQDANTPDMISVFPNPAKDFIQVGFESNLPSDDIQISLFDMTGRIINHISFSQVNDGIDYVIDVRDLSAGIYMLAGRVGAQVFARTIAIIH